MMDIYELYLSMVIDDYGRNIIDQGCSLKNFYKLFKKYGWDIPDDWQKALQEAEKEK